MFFLLVFNWELSWIRNSCFSFFVVVFLFLFVFCFFPGGSLCLKRTRKESFTKIFSQLWYCWCQACRNHESALQKSRDFIKKIYLLKYRCGTFWSLCVKCMTFYYFHLQLENIFVGTEVEKRRKRWSFK